ncbi:MAG: phospholipase D-like domain-containing protein [Bacteroidetes bacterium]|nr:phospholipase D-like domain-containing protein [Bacteroidota bacterium]
MNRILKNHQLPAAIIDLIDESKEYCFLVTPYYKPWTLLTRAFEKAAKQNKNVVFIARFEKEKSIECYEEINKRYDFDVILIENLHTKLYLNERSVIISSMNLLDSSKERNYEIGYLFESKSTVRQFYNEIIKDDLFSLKPKRYFKGRYSKVLLAIKEEENNQKKAGEERRMTLKNKTEKNGGVCIRCSKEIHYSPAAPLCDECYRSWAFWGNWDFIEKYCHACGTEYGTSKNHPLCPECKKIS